LISACSHLFRRCVALDPETGPDDFGSDRLAVKTDARMLVRERMRSALAILVGAAAVALYMGQARSGFLSPQASTPALLQAAISFGMPALIAFIVGFVVRRRGWFAAAAAFLIGLALWVVVELRPSPPWVPTDVGGTWEAVGLRAIIFGVWSALCGAAGSWTARAREGGSIRIS
jgi:Na+/proline symporter